MSSLKVTDSGDGREIHHRLMDDAAVTAQKWWQKGEGGFVSHRVEKYRRHKYYISD